MRTHSVKRKEEEKRQLKNRPRNGIRTPPLFKDETQRREKGERLGRTLSLSLFNVDGKIDADENLRGRAWTDGTCSD